MYWKKKKELIKTLFKRFYCHIQKEENMIFTLMLAMSCIAGLVLYVITATLILVAR